MMVLVLTVQRNEVHVCKAMIAPPCTAVLLTRLTLATCGAVCTDSCRELLVAATQHCADAFTFAWPHASQRAMRKVLTSSSGSSARCGKSSDQVIMLIILPYE
jgi:hypothetical protein